MLQESSYFTWYWAITWLFSTWPENWNTTHVDVNIITTHLILYIDGKNSVIMMMKMINNDNYNLEEVEFLYQKAQKKIQAPGENRTHDPSSFSSDALTTELLEALWLAGSEFNYSYTSQRGVYWGVTRNRSSTSVRPRMYNITWKKENSHTRKLIIIIRKIMIIMWNLFDYLRTQTLSNCGKI